VTWLLLGASQAPYWLGPVLIVGALVALGWGCRR
jgi:hypothetical protein